MRWLGGIGRFRGLDKILGDSCGEGERCLSLLDGLTRWLVPAGPEIEFEAFTAALEMCASQNPTLLRKNRRRGLSPAARKWKVERTAAEAKTLTRV